MIALAVLGYLLGSVSLARLVARLAVPDEDLSTTEFEIEGTSEVWVYRGVSATTLFDRAGWRWGLFVVLGDAAKAFVPTFVVRSGDPESFGFAVIAVAVMAGHVWPVWWRFEGGRGQAVLLGAVLAIDPLAVLVAALGGAVLGVVVFTSVYVARNVGPLVLVPWLGREGWGPELAFAIGVAVIYVLVSWPDVQEERRARAARGLGHLAYPARLRTAWSDFLTED